MPACAPTASMLWHRLRILQKWHHWGKISQESASLASLFAFSRSVMIYLQKYLGMQGQMLKGVHHHSLMYKLEKLDCQQRTDWKTVQLLRTLWTSMGESSLHIKDAIFAYKCIALSLHTKGLGGCTRMWVKQAVRWGLEPDTLLYTLMSTVGLYCFWNFKRLNLWQKKENSYCSRILFYWTKMSGTEVFPTVVPLSSIPFQTFLNTY